jgi:hypothetical protein
MSRIEVVVTGRDLPQFAARAIESVRWQTGGIEAGLIWRDDASAPDVRDRLRTWVEGARGTFLAGEERLFQVGSLDRAIRGRGAPDDIVCLLDGDDYLLPHALRTVAETYRDPEVALTWGSCLVDLDVYRDMAYFGPGVAHSNTPYPPEVWAARAFRRDVFRCFHLRTFRRWLWERIDPRDLRRPDGSAVRGSGDAAFLYPMLELLDDPRHARCVEERIYVYRLHERNVWRTDKPSQSGDFAEIRRRPPYAPMPRHALRELLAASGTPCAGS